MGHIRTFEEFLNESADYSTGRKFDGDWSTHNEFKVGQRWGWHYDTGSVGSYAGPCVVKSLTDTSVILRMVGDMTDGSSRSDSVRKLKLDKAREMVKGNLLKPQR